MRPFLLNEFLFCVPRSRTVKAVSDCFLILLHQDDVNGIAEEYPELMARFIGLRKLGQRKARDYNKATAEMYTSTILDSTDLFSKV